jgi:dTDP-4-amino-4,6-dideoxygalactose transaminase
VVEDAAHATGASLRGEPVGSCRWSDLCVFSFHAVKIITTGEGGMITTNSLALYEKLCRLRTHGIARDPRYRPKGRKQPWYYEKLELGNHYRMTDIQAALGRSQLKKIRTFQRKREKIAETYKENLSRFPLDLPRLTPRARSSWHLYPVCVQGNEGMRNKLIGHLRRDGILANLHYLSVPRFRFYLKKNNKSFFPCPVAAKLAQREISLPIFPKMKTQAVQKVISVLGKVLK